MPEGVRYFLYRRTNVPAYRGVEHNGFGEEGRVFRQHGNNRAAGADTERGTKVPAVTRLLEGYMYFLLRLTVAGVRTPVCTGHARANKYPDTEKEAPCFHAVKLLK